MKKRFMVIAVAAVFALGLTLAGCGSSENEEATETTEAETTTEAVTEEASEAAPAGDQTIQMGNVEMTIPAAWVYDEEDGAEFTHVYKAADGSMEFQIQAIQAPQTMDAALLGEMTQQYADEWGYSDIGYYDDTFGDSIEGYIIPVDATQHPDGKQQRIYTMGKDKTFVAISFTQDGEDFTEMNKAMDSVHWLF